MIDVRNSDCCGIPKGGRNMGYPGIVLVPNRVAISAIILIPPSRNYSEWDGNVERYT